MVTRYVDASSEGETDVYAFASIGAFVDANFDGAIDHMDGAVSMSGSSVGAWTMSLDESVSYQVGVGTEFDETESQPVVGDVDREAGAELFVGLVQDGVPGIVAYAGTEQLWLSGLSEQSGSFYHSLWLADLSGDLTPEVVAGLAVVDAQTGEVRGWLDGASELSDGTVRAAHDLDLDGSDDLLAWKDPTSELVVVDASGQRIHKAEYLSSHEQRDIEPPHVAIGNFDDDAEGEILVVQDYWVAVLDSDGSRLATATFDSENPPKLRNPICPTVAQLDDDEQVEFLVGSEGRVIALDGDLTLLWFHDSQGEHQHSWTNLVAADLDGDGLHETVLQEDAAVVVLGPDGSILSQVTTSFSHSTGANTLAVYDVDQDSLAEVMVPGFLGETPATAILESVEGGWPLVDSDMPWNANAPYPGSRNADGSLPAPSERIHWAEPATNVWNAVPLGTEEMPDLTVEIVDVCVDACDAEARVTVGVANIGTGASRREVEVSVLITSMEAEYITVSVGPLGPGESELFEVSVAAVLLPDGLTVRVDDAQHVAECSEDNNHDTWDEGWCP